MDADTIALHRNWEASPPEIAGHYYFSGTITFNGVGISFEPHSVQLDVVEREKGVEALYHGKQMPLSCFDGRWLGPQPKGTVWS